MKTIRVLLVDDHTLVRAGISALLERMDRMSVVGEAVDGHQAIKLIPELRPDVVLLDLQMRGLSGFEVLKEASKKFPEVKIIVLSVHDSEEYAHRAFASGAVGYLPKSAASVELELALHHAMRGEQYVSPTLVPSPTPLSALTSEARRTEQIELTPRQREVLALVAEGHSTREIAQALGISVKTVETHRAQLMERLGIHDIAGLVRYAIRAGIVNLDD